MEVRKGILISVFAVVLLVVSFYFISLNISKYTGLVISSGENSFLKCLDQKDITLYINSEKASDSLKDSGLMGYLSHIKIVNCLRNNKLCNEKGIDSFPILVAGENKVNGDISVAKLSEMSGCGI